MRNVVAVLMIVGGVALGLYVGVWLCFIGGIVQIVDGVKAIPTDGLDIALGILRIVVAGAAGGISAFLLVIPGVAALR